MVIVIFVIKYDTYYY